MKKTCYVLSYCNEWKEYSSARIVGVYDDIDLLRRKVIKLFLNDEVEFDNIIHYQIKGLVEEDCSHFYDDIEDSGLAYEYVEKQVEKKVEEYKENIINNILNSDWESINQKGNYFMIQEFELNED